MPVEDGYLLLLQITPFSCYKFCQWDGYLSSISTCYSRPEKAPVQNGCACLNTLWGSSIYCKSFNNLWFLSAISVIFTLRIQIAFMVM